MESELVFSLQVSQRMFGRNDFQEVPQGVSPGQGFTELRSQGPLSSPRSQPLCKEKDKGKKSSREIQPQSQGG